MEELLTSVYLQILNRVGLIDGGIFRYKMRSQGSHPAHPEHIKQRLGRFLYKVDQVHKSGLHFVQSNGLKISETCYSSKRISRQTGEGL